ncbi:MAG: hypothetical protein J5644_03960 [Bacteroidales bacterium]|nr:hypothetical protein [Bacteroidales bacterium]
MNTNRIYPVIEEYVKYVYACDGHILPEEDEFFENLLAKYHCGDDDARAVNRRIEELGIGSTADDRLSLYQPGIMLVEDCGCSMERFMHKYQEKEKADVSLPQAQLRDIKINRWLAIIGILISTGVSLVVAYLHW